jgi:D-glycero-D-manno-heptose 1,7-bisphosphate phosphatase
MEKPALFLDRDGVINVNYGYVHQKQNFVFIDGIFDLVREANKLGYLVVVITNQAGIGRGFYSENDFLGLTEWMKQEFLIRNAKIDAVYFCPHHPTEGIGKFKQDCVCRKPKPGMFLQAINELNLDTYNSVMVGDSESDLIASRLSGIRYNLLYSVGRQHEDFVIHSLNEAANYFLGSIQDAL